MKMEVQPCMSLSGLLHLMLANYKGKQLPIHLGHAWKMNQLLWNNGFASTSDLTSEEWQAFTAEAIETYGR